MRLLSNLAATELRVKQPSRRTTVVGENPLIQSQFLRTKGIVMDKEKVTRRAAIGVAIGSVAAAPFIVRALRGKYELDMPDGDQSLSRRNPQYESDWKHYCELLSVPTSEIEGPSTFTLDYHLQTGLAFRAIVVSAVYGQKVTSAGHFQLPQSFGIADGQVCTISPVIDSYPTISLQPDARAVKSPTCDTSLPRRKCVVVAVDGKLYLQEDDRDLMELPSPKVHPACAEFLQAWVHELPVGRPLTTGDEWTIGKNEVDGVELPCKVAGFAEILDRQAVKLVVERHLNADENQRYLAHCLDLESKMPTEFLEEQLEHMLQGESADEAELIRRAMKQAADMPHDYRLKQAIAQQETRSFHIESYVDLATGLTLRQESRTVTEDHSPDGPVTTAVVTYQLFDV